MQQTSNEVFMRYLLVKLNSIEASFRWCLVGTVNSRLFVRNLREHNDFLMVLNIICIK